VTDPYRPPYVHPPVAPPGFRPVLPEHPQATTVLVLGVVGVFVPIVSFVAWSMGNRVLREIRASGPGGSSEQYVLIGRVLGMVLSLLQIGALALGAAGIVSWLIFVGTVVATSGG